jgi:hypothetical protein
MAVHKATKRLHLITNPKRPDVFMGMTDASDPEPMAVLPTSLADAYWDHPSHADAPTASWGTHRSSAGGRPWNTPSS